MKKEKNEFLLLYFLKKNFNKGFNFWLRLFTYPNSPKFTFFNWQIWGRQKAKWLFTYPNSPKFTFFNFVIFRITVSTSLKDLGSTLNIILHFIQKPFCKNKRQIWCLHRSLNTNLILVYVDFLNKILKILSSCKQISQMFSTYITNFQFYSGRVPQAQIQATRGPNVLIFLKNILSLGGASCLRHILNM